MVKTKAHGGQQIFRGLCLKRLTVTPRVWTPDQVRGREDLIGMTKMDCQMLRIGNDEGVYVFSTSSPMAKPSGDLWIPALRLARPGTLVRDDKDGLPDASHRQ